jgi:cytoskeletal protein RodZ
MAETDNDSNSSSLGSALKSERRQKNISLTEISRQTNIGLKALQALENDEFQQIPGGFYLRNYIRSYLAAIGSEEATFFAAYRETLQAAQAGSKEKKKAHYAKLRYSRFKKKKAFLGGFIFFLLFAVGFFILFLGKGHVLGPSLQLPLAGVPPLSFNTTAPFCLDVWPVRVEIEFLDNCWMQVYRGQQQNRQKVGEQVYQKGDHFKINGYALHFSIGNPAALRFYLNGKELTYLKNQVRAEQLTINPQRIEAILGLGK